MAWVPAAEGWIVVRAILCKYEESVANQRPPLDESHIETELFKKGQTIYSGIHYTDHPKCLHF